MTPQFNTRLILPTTVAALLILVLASPGQRLFAQTFEEPVTVLEDTRLVN